MQCLYTLQRKVSLDLQRHPKGKGVPLPPLGVPVRSGLLARYDGVTDVTSGMQSSACFAGTSPAKKEPCLFRDRCH